MEHIILGRKAEDAAADYLEQQGYRLRKRNFRCFVGEIDIIAEDGETLVFVEVRSRSGADFGWHQETVNWVKQRKVRKVAEYYLQCNKELQQRECRFDVIGVLFEQQDTIKTVELFKNAF